MPRERHAWVPDAPFRLATGEISKARPDLVKLLKAREAFELEPFEHKELGRVRPPPGAKEKPEGSTSSGLEELLTHQRATQPPVDTFTAALALARPAQSEPNARPRPPSSRGNIRIKDRVINMTNRTTHEEHQRIQEEWANTTQRPVLAQQLGGTEGGDGMGATAAAAAVPTGPFVRIGVPVTAVLDSRPMAMDGGLLEQASPGGGGDGGGGGMGSRFGSSGFAPFVRTGTGTGGTALGTGGISGGYTGGGMTGVAMSPMRPRTVPGSPGGPGGLDYTAGLLSPPAPSVMDGGSAFAAWKKAATVLPTPAKIALKTMRNPPPPEAVLVKPLPYYEHRLDAATTVAAMANREPSLHPEHFATRVLREQFGPLAGAVKARPFVRGASTGPRTVSNTKEFQTFDYMARSSGVKYYTTDYEAPSRAVMRPPSAPTTRPAAFVSAGEQLRGSKHYATESVAHLTTESDSTIRYKHFDQMPQPLPSALKRPLTAGGVHLLPYVNLPERAAGVVFYP